MMREIKVKTENKNILRYCTVIGVLVIVIAGLCAYIFIDFKADGAAVKSRTAFAEAGLKGTARVLEDDIAAGDMMLAYHHAAEAADYAEEAGEEGAAVMFDKIAASILGGTLDGKVTAAIDGFIVSGLVPEEIPMHETAEERAAPVSAEAYESARECAAKFFGGGMLTKGDRLQNGKILFSVSNAYAVIDGDKCVPVEAAISLGEGDAVLGESECVSAAVKFIADFFPDEMSRSVKIKKTESVGLCRADVYAEAGGVDMCITVRRDSGRVVRFVSGAK